MTTRYYIEATFNEVPHEPYEIDKLTDQIMDGLLDLEEHKPEICDPSVGADLSARRIEVYLAVDAVDPGEALHIFMTSVQSTLHGIGIGTPGWGEMIQAMSFRVNSQRSTELTCA